MTTRTWTNAAGGAWTTASNWSGGVAPTSVDDVLIPLAASSIITLPSGTTSANSIVLSSTNGNGMTLSLAATSVLAAPTITLTSGVIKGGTIVGTVNVLNGAGTSTLDGTTVNGTVKVGSSAQPGNLSLATSLTLGANAVLDLSGVQQSSTQATTPSSLRSTGNVTITGGRILVEAGVGQAFNPNGGSLTISGSTTIDVQGNLGTNNAQILGTVAIGPSGTLSLTDTSSGATRPTIAGAASVSVASGGRLILGYDNHGISSTELTAAASHMTGAGSFEVRGRIDNTGSAIDLTPGSPLSKVTYFNTVPVSGGTIVNNGPASVPLPFADVTGVSLVGTFALTNSNGSLIVHDGLSITAANGGPGTLDLATGHVALAFGTPTVPGPIATISNLTINAGPSIDGGDLATFGQSTTMNFISTATLRGVAVDAGIINISGSGTTLTINGADSGTGTFENDGTINVGAESTLSTARAIVNKGTINVANGGSLSLAAGAAGAIALTGTNDRVTFNGPGDSASISGFTAGDIIVIGNATAGTAVNLSLSGQTLTVAQGATTLATLALSDPGKAAYAVTDFAASVANNGTVTLSTAHGAPVVVTPTTPTGPTTPIGPTTPTGPTTPVSYEPYVAYSTSSGSSQAQMTAGGNGGPSYLQHTYIWDRPDGVAMRADAANSFIHGGPGQDALQVTSGTNVLDGGTGSNYMTGTVAGAGTDTFFTDTRDGVVVWNTIINFHQGDAATIWGFNPGVSSYYWDTSISGAAGATGATLRANIVGGAGRSGDGIDASVTFAGLSITQAQSLVHTTGSQGAGNYLYFYNQGV